MREYFPDIHLLFIIHLEKIYKTTKSYKSNFRIFTILSLSWGEWIMPFLPYMWFAKYKLFLLEDPSP